MVYFNYDTNLRLTFKVDGNNNPSHLIRVILGKLDYRASIDVEVGGNCLGWNVFDTAVDKAFDKVMGGKTIAEFILTNPQGDRLICELFTEYTDGTPADPDEHAEYQFHNMIVGIEILDYRQIVKSDNKESANG
jgi:hypothetical protein